MFDTLQPEFSLQRCGYAMLNGRPTGDTFELEERSFGEGGALIEGHSVFSYRIGYDGPDRIIEDIEFLGLRLCGLLFPADALADEFGQPSINIEISAGEDHLWALIDAGELP